MNNRVVAVLTVIKCLHAQKILPSPPKIVYGGFVPIIMDNQFSENINVEHKLSFDRKSKSLPLYTDKISQSKDKSKNNFSFSIKQFVTLQASICSSLASLKLCKVVMVAVVVVTLGGTISMSGLALTSTASRGSHYVSLSYSVLNISCLTLHVT